MVPNGVPRQPLRFFFAEYFPMPLIFRGDASDGRCRNSLWMEGDPSEEVVIPLFLSGDVSLSGYKGGSLRIVGSEYHWELCVVDPSAFPIYSWLCSGKPWISEDGLLFPKLGKVKSEIGMIGSRLHL